MLPATLPSLPDARQVFSTSMMPVCAGTAVAHLFGVQDAALHTCSLFPQDGIVRDTEMKGKSRPESPSLNCFLWHTGYLQT